MNTFGIGELAKRAGVPIDTVRYYEKHDLVRPQARAASGYRRYGDVELARLRFIRRAKVLGFSLAEIAELLSLSGSRNVAEIRRAATRRRDDVVARIAELERIRDGLTTLIDACPGHGRVADCPILRALGQEGDA